MVSLSLTQGSLDRLLQNPSYGLKQTRSAQRHAPAPTRQELHHFVPFAPPTSNARTQSSSSRFRRRFSGLRVGKGKRKAQAYVSMMSAAVEKVDVAIIGGGPAGLTTAKGITTACPELKVRVFERAEMRPRGASVFVMPNGLHALEAIDPAVHAAVLKCHSPAGNVTTRNQADELLAEEEGDAMVDSLSAYGPCSYLLWATLQKTLADSLPQGVLETGLSFGSLEEDGDLARVKLKAAGRQSEEATAREVEAKVVIGADGNQSRTRQHLLGDGPPEFLGTAVFRALLPRPAQWVEPGSSTIWAGGKQAFRTAVFQGDVITWTGIVPWPQEEAKELKGRAYISDAEDGRFSVKDRCLAAFEDWPETVRGIISETDPDTILLHGQNYREPETCHVWGRGRATLVGDAAHLGTPLLGQGTSQALEDALELSRRIREFGPTPEALRAYERARIPMAQPVQSLSVDLFKRFQAGEMFPPDNEIELNVERGSVKRTFAPLMS